MSDQTSFVSTASDKRGSAIIITVFFLKTTIGKSLFVMIIFICTFS